MILDVDDPLAPAVGRARRRGDAALHLPVRTCWRRRQRSATRPAGAGLDGEPAGRRPALRAAGPSASSRDVPARWRPPCRRWPPSRPDPAARPRGRPRLRPGRRATRAGDRGRPRSGPDAGRAVALAPAAGGPAGRGPDAPGRGGSASATSVPSRSTGAARQRVPGGGAAQRDARAPAAPPRRRSRPRRHVGRATASPPPTAQASCSAVSERANAPLVLAAGTCVCRAASSANLHSAYDRPDRPAASAASRHRPRAPRQRRRRSAGRPARRASAGPVTRSGSRLASPVPSSWPATAAPSTAATHEPATRRAP